MKHLTLFGFLFSFATGISQERQPSASENVIIPTDSVYISELGRYRKTRIYLPKNYDSSGEKYPVLYMMDGQNLFDVTTSYVEEWGVDEILDSLYDAIGFKLIVVGLDNGQSKRLNEYSPWDHEKYGNGEGEAFLRFIVNELKPVIDREYRTLPEAENTGFMGSSLGALIAHYAIFQYPDIFGRAGLFSPSYWYSDDVWEYTKSRKYSEKHKFYILVGGKEGEPMEEGSTKMKNLLQKTGYTDNQLAFLNDAQGQHNELLWRKYFDRAILFLYDR